MDAAMDEDAMITITRVDHPKATVRLCDLPAGGDYFQRLWLPVAGPSVVALINRSQELTQRGGGRADISVKDLAKSLGVPGRLPKGATAPNQPESDRLVFGKNSVLLRTLTRVQHMGLGRVHMGADAVQFVSYSQVAPLPARQMARLPEFLRQDHWDAMQPVAARFAERGLDLGALTDLGPRRHRPPGDAAQRGAARLEQLRTRPAATSAPAVSPAVSPVASL
jgi:hypothetical protein